MTGIVTKVQKLKKEFYLRKTEIVAKELLGKKLVYGNKAAIIVETEAYIPENDPANHAARGKTMRNEAMHEAGGILYVYKIYGIHYCSNVVTESSGMGCAVLLRAAMPVSGIDEMKHNRNTDKIENLCKGPGNLAKAFGFNHELNFAALDSDELFIADDGEIRQSEIIADKRIGISKAVELPLRFYLANNPYVSGKKIR